MTDNTTLRREDLIPLTPEDIHALLKDSLKEIPDCGFANSIKQAIIDMENKYKLDHHESPRTQLVVVHSKVRHIHKAYNELVEEMEDLADARKYRNSLDAIAGSLVNVERHLAGMIRAAETKARKEAKSDEKNV